MSINIHVDTEVSPPEDMSETQKMMALVDFWNRWADFTRGNVIKRIEEIPHYWCDALLGINVAVLNSLQEIDLKKLHEELEDILKKIESNDT
jgi:hypothetical protein